MQTLLFNGIFYTGSDGRARAVLVTENGLIAEVFRIKSNPLFLQKSDIRHYDLGGRFIFPAFEDAHNHPAARARTWYELDFRNKDTAWKEVADAIRDKAAATLPNTWIVCHGWSQTKWPGLTQGTLDHLSQDHGILLAHVSYHGGIINKKGASLLKKQGIALHSLDDSGRITEQDFEQAMIATSGTREQYLKTIPLALIALRDKGIIAVHDMHVATMEQIEAYLQLAHAGLLPIDVALYLNPRLLDDPRVKTILQRRHENLTVAGVKLFLDGAIGTSTAAVTRPYRDGTGTGTLRMNLAESTDAIRKAATLGLRHVAMHCIGDRAVTLAANTIEHLQDEYRRDITAWRFEHFEMPSESAIRALADRGGIASMQPNFSWDIAHYHARLGDNVKLLNPFREIYDRGITLAFGSDDMPSDPIEGIRWATFDAPSSGQQLKLAEALRAYTATPAEIIGAENRRGKIEKGYEANFAVFGKDPFAAGSDTHARKPQEVWRRGVRVV